MGRYNQTYINYDLVATKERKAAIEKLFAKLIYDNDFTKSLKEFYKKNKNITNRQYLALERVTKFQAYEDRAKSRGNRFTPYSVSQMMDIAKDESAAYRNRYAPYEMKEEMKEEVKDIVIKAPKVILRKKVEK